MSNQKCETRPQIVSANGDDPVVFPYNVKTSKCGGSCNNINNPCPKLCVPDVVKSLNVKMFNLVSGTNETRHVECMKRVGVNLDLNIVFAIINSVETINAGVYAKN